MHPSELKNRALVAAAKAEMDGFIATAEALILLASACASEAQELEVLPRSPMNEERSNSIFDRIRYFEVVL